MGCVMSPWLFNIYMDGVMREVKDRYCVYQAHDAENEAVNKRNRCRPKRFMAVVRVMWRPLPERRKRKEENKVWFMLQSRRSRTHIYAADG